MSAVEFMRLMYTEPKMFGQFCVGTNRSKHYLFSNIAGPKKNWSFLGSKVDWVSYQIPSQNTVSLTVFSMGDVMKLSMTTDKSTFTKDKELMAIIMQNLTED